MDEEYDIEMTRDKRGQFHVNIVPKPKPIDATEGEENADEAAGDGNS